MQVPPGIISRVSSLRLWTHLAGTLQMLRSWSRHAPLWPIGRTTFRGGRDARDAGPGPISAHAPMCGGIESAMWAFRLVLVRPIGHHQADVCLSHDVQRFRQTSLWCHSHHQLLLPSSTTGVLFAWTSAFRVPGTPEHAGRRMFCLFRITSVVRHFVKSSPLGNI